MSSPQFLVEGKGSETGTKRPVINTQLQLGENGAGRLKPF
jgi:hypothetical protein